jgi:hypothetical protein
MVTRTRLNVTLYANSLSCYRHENVQCGVRDEAQEIVSTTETVLSVRNEPGLKKQLRIEHDRL